MLSLQATKRAYFLMIAYFKKLNNSLTAQPKMLAIIIVFLLIVSLFINLGILPLHKDEPIRALVALEMILSDNFIVPTLNGEFYYRKGPIYNWLILPFFYTLGINELSVRLPSVLSFLGFGFVIYWTLKYYLSKKVAFFSSFLFLVSSVLFFQIVLDGLIDIFYSLITFLQFFVIFHFYQKKKYHWLFIFSYILTAIGLLTKGLPSIAFQGITVLAYLAYHKKWRLLFGWQHLLGIATFLIFVSVYYVLYSQYNSIEGFLSHLWTESSQRTFLETQPKNSLKHFLTFPFRFLIWVLPSALFVIYLFKVKSISIIKSNPLLLFLTIVLLANFPVYWLSTTTMNNPRYVLMLFPLLTTVLVFFYLNYRNDFKKLSLWIQRIFSISTFGAALACIIPIFHPNLSILPNIIPICIVGFLLLSIIGLLLWLPNSEPLFLFIAAILVVRIIFDLSIIPSRLYADPWQKQKEFCYEMAELSKDVGIYVFAKTHVEEHISFYLSQKQNRIITRSYTPDTNSYFIMSKHEYQEIFKNHIEVIDTIQDGFYSPVLVRFTTLPPNQLLNSIQP